MPYVLYGIILIALIILVRNIRIVPQAQAYVITRLGAYKTTWGVGLHLKIPFIESVAKRLSLKEQVADFPPQPVITKDNVTMQIDTVVYYQITDPKLYTYGIEQPILAIENLSATTLRNLIGDLELDQCLTSRDIVNTKMRQILDEATDPWGIKVNRVELKNILPPKEIQNAMEKQMKAERERREAILRAEGEKPTVWNQHVDFVTKEKIGRSAQFEIPDLPVGTFDTLMSLSDELGRVDTFAESLCRKVITTLTELYNSPSLRPLHKCTHKEKQMDEGNINDVVDMQQHRGLRQRACRRGP